MKRKLLKGFSMLFLLLTVAFATAVASVNAQSTQRVSAHIPFDFIAGDKTLPAGEYIANSTDGSGSALRIQNATTGEGAFRLSNSIEPRRNKTEARMVFHKYGQTYFLAEVWSGGTGAGRQLIQSKRERAMNRELGSIAQRKYETVELVAVVR